MESVTPREILARVRDVYTSAAAYRDQGRGSVISDDGNGLSGVFFTAFLRSRGLHYEFRPDVGEPIVIDAKFGGSVEVRGMDFPTDSLNTAVAYLTGFTVRSAHTMSLEGR